MTAITETAPAKVNLTLEVHGRRADGYHELVSLVAFACDVSDSVRLELGGDLSVDATGRFGQEISGENLIATAAGLARAARPGIRLGRFTVDKTIPVAAGVGGGSADAAAALRALARANGLSDPVQAFGAIAPQIGADVAVCLGGGGCQAALMSGIGERVARPENGTLLDGFDVHGVLVNPGVQVATGAVFKALAAPALADLPPAPALPKFAGLAGLIAYLTASRNDLEPPALAIAPVIGEVLARLSAQRDCRLARMSGSGATCFGLFASADAARQAAAALSASQPDWWVVPSRFC